MAKIRKKISDWDAASAAPFVAKHEGCRLTAYKCPAGRWTIGYGATYVAGKPVTRGQTITQDEADKLLVEDLCRFQRELAPLVCVEVTRGQFVALIDFVYNTGVHAFAASTLRRLVNSGREANAAYEFRKWRYVRDPKRGLIESPGLVRRREDEKNMYLS